MVNPFDRNFLKFFIGFVFILIVSFILLAVVQGYADSLDGPAQAVQG